MLRKGPQIQLLFWSSVITWLLLPLITPADDQALVLLSRHLVNIGAVICSKFLWHFVKVWGGGGAGQEHTKIKALHFSEPDKLLNYLRYSFLITSCVTFLPGFQNIYWMKWQLEKEVILGTGTEFQARNFNTKIWLNYQIFLFNHRRWKKKLKESLPHSHIKPRMRFKFSNKKYVWKACCRYFSPAQLCY